jgi:hypothetical protein
MRKEKIIRRLYDLKGYEMFEGVLDERSNMLISKN